LPPTKTKEKEMSLTIYKYVLTNSISTFYMPVGAKIIHVGKDPASPCPAIWAEVDISVVSQDQREFEYVGTGQPLYPRFGDSFGEHIGTTICDPFVWHVYETTPR
jgi:hypothetical protein